MLGLDGAVENAGEDAAVVLNDVKACALAPPDSHVRREPALHAANFAALYALFEAGKLRPHVTPIDGLERTADALELINGRRSTGKVVIHIAAE